MIDTPISTRTVVVSVRMPESLRDQLVTLASADQRSANQMTILVLKAGLKALAQAQYPAPDRP